MLSGLSEWVTDVIDRLGYIGVALLVALENLFPPIPSEIVLPFAGFVASDGKATLTVGPFGSVGDKTVDVRYFGDDYTLEGDAATSVEVVKGNPKVNASGPATATLGQSRPKVTVTVSEADIQPTGTVVFRVDGVKVAAKSLSGGKASVELKRFFKTGRHVVYKQETPMNNLYLSMLERIGVQQDKLGDSKGRLSGLDG